MQDFQIIKCPSCGSTVIETKSDSIAECSYCGSKIILSNNKVQSVNNKKSKWVFAVVLSVIVIALLAYQLLKSKQAEEKPIQIEKPSIGIPNLKVNLPKLNAKAMTITQEDLDKNKLEPTSNPNIDIVRQVQAKTLNGGLYWIITIRNDSTQTVYRPGVIASLFDGNNKRIEEQKGWTKLSQLEPGKQADLLLYVPNPPQGNFTSQLTAMGSFSSFIKPDQQNIEIVDFIVKPKYNSKVNVEIIGDVKNTHDFQVDFVRVVAIAKDTEGNTIGLADSFVSKSSLKANAQSGFKINAGTFVTEPPDSWSLWAFGKKHRDKL